jgi:hypothetical protein
MIHRLVLVATLAAVTAGAASAAGRMFTAAEVKRFVRAEAGVHVARLDSASTNEVTTLSPGITPRRAVVKRYGHFELLVLAPATQRRVRRELLGRTRPDRNGIYWEHDQQGGWVAYTAYGGNVLLSWFPNSGVHRIDARWRRLHAIMRRLR